MGRLLFTGGTVFAADVGHRADVLVEDEKMSAVGVGLDASGAEEVDATGRLVMPGFIDGHTHMDMPFGGTVTADDRASGTAAALAGGTTTIVDSSLQDVEGDLAGTVETWTDNAEGKAHTDHGFRVAITNFTEEVKAEIPSLRERGVSPIEIFMAYKGTPLYAEDDDLFEALQVARQAGILVMVHAENGDAIAKLQEQAFARGDTAPRFHALTRPPEVEAEATNRAIRLAGVADAPLLVVAALLSTNRARIHGMYPREGALVSGADLVLRDPELGITATVENRHGDVDYTPYEGMTFSGGPAAVSCAALWDTGMAKLSRSVAPASLSSGRLFPLEKGR